MMNTKNDLMSLAHVKLTTPLKLTAPQLLTAPLKLVALLLRAAPLISAAQLQRTFKKSFTMSFRPQKKLLFLFCLLFFSACASKTQHTSSSDTEIPRGEAVSEITDQSATEAQSQAQIEQQETEKEIYATLASLNESAEKLKMYCKKIESPKVTHHFLFFERELNQPWTAKIHTEFFNSQKKRSSVKVTSEFPVKRTDDIIQSTEDVAKRQFYLEFPSINSIAEVKFRAKYQGDRTPQSFVPKEQSLSDVNCFEQY